jgi:nicotinate-nucleotide pyrophosphorylase (carboxylating)
VIEPALDELAAKALAEDVGPRDVTSEAVVEAGTRARARIEQKQPGVLYGFDVARAVFRRVDALLEWRALAPEGEWRAETRVPVAEIEGDARSLLAGERVALNFLQRLSGVATLTARCVHALRGTEVIVLDTRKTTPGLRLLEKRAVAAGGGQNHRMGLWDAVLVKENHAALAGGVGEATRRAIAGSPAGMAVEVECRTLADVEEALAAGAERLLLDNMEPDQIEEAVAVVGGRAALEASGSIGPQSVRAYAVPGLQFISIGALTHSAPALDLSMKIEPA